jgi:hypothetical protein
LNDIAPRDLDLTSLDHRGAKLGKKFTAGERQNIPCKNEQKFFGTFFKKVPLLK